MFNYFLVTVGENEIQTQLPLFKTNLVQSMLRIQYCKFKKYLRKKMLLENLNPNLNKNVIVLSLIK